MHESILKICIVGPCRSGKTLLAKIIGQQPLLSDDNSYTATKALRIQETTVFVDMECVQLQLWDCSGGTQYRKFWKALSQDLDGLILVFNSAEKDLSLMERMHKNFALKRSLDVQQCLLMALSTPQSGGDNPMDDEEFKAKFGHLPFAEVQISPADIEISKKILLKSLRPFLKDCLAKKRDRHSD